MTDSIYIQAADALKALGLIEARRDRKIARAETRCRDIPITASRTPLTVTY